MARRTSSAMLACSFALAACATASDAFVPDSSPLVAAAPNAFGLCVLHASGVVSCRGLGDHGELGDGRATHTATLVELGQDISLDWTHARGITDAIALAANGLNACAVRRDRTIVCWGFGTDGLGDGAVLHETCHDPSLFLDPDTVDCATAPVAVAGITDAVAVDVGDGGAAACVRRATGEVACWGANASFSGTMLTGTPTPIDEGVHDAIDVAVTGQAVCVLHVPGTVSCRGFAPFLHSVVTGTIAGVSDAVQLASGSSYLCALRRAGDVVCWGDGEDGQLGDGTLLGHAAPASVVGVTDAVEIGAGDATTCARRTTGRVACWGRNGYPSATRFGNGGLGDGLESHESCTESSGVVADCSSSPVEVAGLTDAVAIYVGGSTSCARRATGDIVCWGSSASGQLGADRLRQEATTTPVPVTAD